MHSEVFFFVQFVKIMTTFPDAGSVHYSISSCDSDEDDESESSDSSEDGESSDSENEEDLDDEGDNEDQADVPLYENARVTQMESIIMILTFALSFSVSGQCIARLLELIELHCPRVNRCLNTLYKFKKVFADIGRNIIVLHYFCGRCYSNLQGKDSICGVCENETEVSFFIEIPFINQLQRMFLRPGFVKKFAHRFN